MPEGFQPFPSGWTAYVLPFISSELSVKLMRPRQEVDAVIQGHGMVISGSFLFRAISIFLALIKVGRIFQIAGQRDWESGDVDMYHSGQSISTSAAADLVREPFIPFTPRLALVVTSYVLFPNR